MPLVWLALAGLRSSRTFPLLAIAVAFASGFQISNAANLAGFESSLLDDGLAHGAGDVRVWPRGRQRFDDAEVAALAPPDTEAVPLLTFPGSVARSDRRSVTAPIWGVDASARHPPFRLVAGDPLPATPAKDVDVLIGTALAVQLGIQIGDRVELHAILGARDLDSSSLALAGTVRGLVSGTRGGSRAAFVDRAVLGAAAGTPHSASMVALHTGDHGAAGDVAARIESSHPDVEARAWNDDDLGLTSFLGLRRMIGGISYAMVIAAIAIPMCALIYIHVLRRQRELAILAAIGFSRRDLFAVCTLQSAIVATIGCALGAVLGVALTAYFAANPLFEWGGFVVRPQLGIATFATIYAVIVATSVAATIYPAARAARVDPAVVLRRVE